MPSLFNMPTPEEVRREARMNARQEALLFAQGQGRGPVMAASQAGALFGEGIARAAGGKLPEEVRAEKYQALQQAVTAEFDADGDGRPDQPANEDDYIKLLDITAKHASQFGLMDVAEQAMSQKMQLRMAMGKKLDDRWSDPQQMPNAEKGVIGVKNLTTNEWKKLDEPARPLVNVDNRQDLEGTKFAYKMLEEEYNTMKSAREGSSAIEQMDDALRGVETGGLTEWKKSLGQLAASFNVKIPDIDKLETAYAATGPMVLATMKAFGGADSNEEKAFAQNIAPKLSQTPEGRKQISAFLKKSYERRIKRYEMMQEHVDANPDSNLKGFETKWNSYIKENPLITNDMKAYEKLPKGTEIIPYKDGSIWAIVPGQKDPVLIQEAK